MVGTLSQLKKINFVLCRFDVKYLRGILQDVAPHTHYEDFFNHLVLHKLFFTGEFVVF